MNWTDNTGILPAPLSDLEVVYSKIVEIVLGFAGVVFFVLIILSGFKYLTSGGDPKMIEQAKKTLTAALAGLVLIVLSLLIIRLIEEFTGVNVSEFKIYQP